MPPLPIGLEIPADVLRLPLSLITRLVLAEIVALAGQPGCSAQYLAARLTLCPSTASAAVRRLAAVGLVAVPTGRGARRRLVPHLAAIAAAAVHNSAPTPA